MFLVGLLSWWYGRGWVGQLARVSARLKATFDFFSVGQLLATLFSPFRQISAGYAGDTFGAAIRGMLDKLLSRIIGAIIRFFTIIAGLIFMTLQIVYEAVVMILWWFVPLLPIVGLVLLAIGWVPIWK